MNVKYIFFFTFSDKHQQLLYHLSQSKSTSKNRTGLQKILITMPKVNPDICIEALSQDPLSREYTGFTIHDSITNNNLGTFHAEDIVQQRNFMVALGGRGPGLFTQNTDNTSEEISLFNKEQPYISIPTNCELLERQLSYDSQWRYSITDLPSYECSMKHLPGEYYFSQEYKALSQFPASELPVFNPVSKYGTAQPLQLLHKRKVKDTFLPPHGSATYHPVSIGYGKEVGLDEHLQAIWDMHNKFYYFLNHNTKSSFLNDPRPLNSIINPMKKEEFVCEDPFSSDHQFPVCKDALVVKLAAQRALKKPHGFLVRGFGVNGNSGNNGSKGGNGLKGVNGMVEVSGNGGNGEDGTSGGNGGHGSNGENGANGKKFLVKLSGDASRLSLCINGKGKAFASIGGETNEEVVFIDCHGGDGGEGGMGGSGGTGGSAGDGGKGGKHGDGGHGGNGGNGGTGGNGGAGGNAGSGGVCIVTASDPRLMMLVEVDCRAGDRGRGGAEGKGGDGGKGGYGGEGGFWNEVDLSPAAIEGSVVAVRGTRGKPGNTGTSGLCGIPGEYGTEGENGGLLWVIESSSGEVLQQAKSRYEAIVTSLNISPPNHGAIYEPNQAITISQVVITNTGGLPIPQGAELSFPTTKTIRFEPVTYKLPEISPNNSFTVPADFKGRIFDQATPNLPGPFSGEASFVPRIDILGRPFDTSLTKTLPVSYPVKLSFALSRRNISRGEIAVLEVGVENTSQMVHYGSNLNCKGSVAVRLHLDSHLIPLGIQQNLTRNDDNKPMPFQVTHDPDIEDSMWVKINELNPREVLTIPIAFQMDHTAQICDTCIWQSDLYFKGKLIEYMSQEIHVTPDYSPPTSPSSIGDILMIMSKAISETELALWQKIFDILHLNVDYWDEHVSSGDEDESNPTNKVPSSSSNPGTDFPSFSFYKMYAGKTIIYPHCKLDHIPSELIISHFSSSATSSMLLFLSQTTPKSLEDYFYDHTGHSQILRHLCHMENCINLPEDANSGYHLLTPGILVSADVSIKRSEKKIMKKLEKEYPSQALAMFRRSNIINQKSTYKYTYGSVDIKKCPIQRSANFQCVDGAGGSLTSMGTDDPLLMVNSREFPLGSKFGQVFLAVLVSIPLDKKLSILRNTESKSSQGFVKCHLPNGLYLKKQQLAAITIAQEIADEILDCNRSISKMKLVAQSLKTNKGLYSKIEIAPIVKQMLLLIQQEVLERAKLLEIPAVQSASKEIQAICKSCISDTLHLSADDIPLFTNKNQALGMLDIPKRNIRLKESNSSTCLEKTSTTNSLHDVPSRNTHLKESNSYTYLEKCNTTSIFSSDSNSSTHLSSHSKERCSTHLPPLRILQDSIHILRSHQLTLEDNCYDVSR